MADEHNPYEVAAPPALPVDPGPRGREKHAHTIPASGPHPEPEGARLDGSMSHVVVQASPLRAQMLASRMVSTSEFYFWLGTSAKERFQGLSGVFPIRLRLGFFWQCDECEQRLEDCECVCSEDRMWVYNNQPDDWDCQPISESGPDWDALHGDDCDCGVEQPPSTSVTWEVPTAEDIMDAIRTMITSLNFSIGKGQIGAFAHANELIESYDGGETYDLREVRL